jgi:hypothetical protein
MAFDISTLSFEAVFQLAHGQLKTELSASSTNLRQNATKSLAATDELNSRVFLGMEACSPALPTALSH